MRALAAFLVALVLATLAGYGGISHWLSEKNLAAELKRARSLAVTCGLESRQIRSLPRTRADGPRLGLTGFYLDPKTNEKDSRVTCLERAMRDKGIVFRDEMLRTNFVPEMNVP